MLLDSWWYGGKGGRGRNSVRPRDSQASGSGWSGSWVAVGMRPTSASSRDALLLERERSSGKRRSLKPRGRPEGGAKETRHCDRKNDTGAKKLVQRRKGIGIEGKEWKESSTQDAITGRKSDAERQGMELVIALNLIDPRLICRRNLGQQPWLDFSFLPKNNSSLFLRQT